MSPNPIKEQNFLKKFSTEEIPPAKAPEKRSRGWYPVQVTANVLLYCACHLEKEPAVLCLGLQIPSMGYIRHAISSVRTGEQSSFHSLRVNGVKISQSKSHIKQEVQIKATPKEPELCWISEAVLRKHPTSFC